MKTLGIVFSNIYDESLGDLTKHRTVASLPFGGRYRQIDFMLSNMVNSNITSVGIITKYNYHSLMDHLSTTSEWDLNRKNGGLHILPPFGTGNTNVYRGKIEALDGASKFIEGVNCEYVLLSDSNVLCNIDYQKVMDFHTKSGSDVTIIANRIQDSGEKYDLVLKVDGNQQNQVTDVLVNSAAKDDALCGMGMYLMKKNFLLEMIADSVAHGYYHFEKHFIQKYFMNGDIKMSAYEFKGIVLRNDSIPKYFQNNMKLLDEEVRDEIFNSKKPIYTKVRDEVPTHYGEHAEVNECMIADGCRIDGSVERSILFRDVSLGKNCVIRNSIIMQGTSIGENVIIENAIIDKNVIISNGTKLIGVESAPVIIKKGERIMSLSSSKKDKEVEVNRNEGFVCC